LKVLQAFDARRGTVVRVKNGHWKSQFSGMHGTIQEWLVGYVPAGAAEVLLEDGSLRLFWLSDLTVVHEDITV
jgi:hypothetical protein